VAEQSVDLRSTLSILRRHRLVLALAALVGVLAGVGLVLLRPPMYASTSQVLLPPVQQTADGQTPTRDVNTEIRVAKSDGVLGPAGQAVTPQMTVQAMSKRVDVSAPTTDVLVITSRAETPGRAEALSRAMAAAELAYVNRAASTVSTAASEALARRQQTLESSLETVNSEIRKAEARKQGEDPASTQGQTDAAALAQLTAEQANLALQIDQIKQKEMASQPQGNASIIQQASPAKRAGLVSRSIIFSAIGLLLALGVAALVLVLLGKRDPRLRYRDEIADALGSPVVASLRSRAPRNIVGWSSLLEDYTPGAVDSWALRQTLRQLSIDVGGAPRRHGERGETLAHPPSITVITLSDDVRALALGPQVAAYAASVGLRTVLVAAHRHESASALWAACSQSTDELRPGLEVDTQVRKVSDADLTVVLAVVDRSKPELNELPQSAVTVLAVSAGSATAEELARTAVNADDAGSRITGILVADPDDLDRTTGRMLRTERTQQVPLPSHLTGVPGSGTTGSNVSGIRRRPR
jgi:capsular polysaccharide biosynthesis protein